MFGNKYFALAGTVLMLLSMAPVAAQQRPIQKPPVTGVGETRHEQVLQFLQQVAWARYALDQDLQGQGAEALDNARLLLEDARGMSGAAELGGVSELLTQAQDAVRRGDYARAVELLTGIEKSLGQTMEEAVGADRPQPPPDP